MNKIKNIIIFYKYIVMSFIYVITSEERTNTDSNQVFYNINFGGFGSSNQKYNVEVLQFRIDDVNINADRMYVVTAENLFDNGVFCKSILSNSQSILAVIDNNDKYVGSNNCGIFGTVSNCNMSKQVVIRILDVNLNPVEDGTDINVVGDSIWFLTLKISPI